MSDRYSPKEMLARLIAFDSISHKSNLPIVDFIADYLAGHGISCHRIESEDGKKANLFATIGPENAPGIALSGHLDVVPVTGQNWTSDPFELREAEGKLYGRGTVDMKGFVACALAAVPDFAQANLKHPIHLAFSYDEEVGCIGVRGIIKQFGQQFAKPAIVIVGEPTAMRVIDAHKGIHAFETEIVGRAAHNSMPHIGVNAIEFGAQFIAEIERLASELRQRADGERFDPPCTTLTVATIEGGEAVNIVPQSCRITWQFRNVPATDPEEIPRRLEEFANTKLLPAMRAVRDEPAINTRKINEVPSFAAREGSEAVSLALQLAQENALHAVPYGTEAGLFEQADAPAVVCGPGQPEQAHTADEFIEIAQIEECSAFLKRLVGHASA